MSSYRAVTLFAAVLACNGFGSVNAQDVGKDPGLRLLQRNCASCHGVTLSDKSRHPAAPHFRQILKRYPGAMLAEALAEGLTTGHPDMPEFVFEPDQVAAIINYLDRLSKE
jgi:mono/diheme cytochrome c family protein